MPLPPCLFGSCCGVSIHPPQLDELPYLPSTARSMMVGWVFLVLTGQRTPRRRSAGVPPACPPAVRRRSAGGPPAFRTRSAPVPHRCRTGAAPVPHRCRTGAAAVPQRIRTGTCKQPGRRKQNWVFFFVFFGVFVLLGVFLCFLGGVFARRRRAAHPPAFRTRSALCSALVPHLCRTCCSEMWADLRRGALCDGRLPIRPRFWRVYD